jgi:type IX secretion system PorP/SprF family membrane protein
MLNLTYDKMKKILAATIGVVMATSLFAQQEVMISHYMFNGLFLNPAYAGSHPYMSASLLHRSQWVKLDGAPKTQVFGIDAPILNNKLGVGLSVINDKIGDTGQLEINGNVSYHLQLDSENKHRLSFGIKAGVTNYTARLTQTEVWDENDPVFSADINNQLIPRFGAGVYYYSERVYVGFSIPTIYAADSKIKFNVDNNDNSYYTSHMYLNAGVVINASEKVKIKPSTLIKYETNSPINIDINCNVLWNNLIWLGASYRNGDAIVALLDVNITPQLRAGYSYDFTISKLNNYSNGTHEIMIGYQFGKDKIKTRSPRYF